MLLIAYAKEQKDWPKSCVIIIQVTSEDHKEIQKIYLVGCHYTVFSPAF